MSEQHNDHMRIDERSLAMHGLIAKKLLADPSMILHARANLRRWQSKHGTSTIAWAEWDVILSLPADRIASLLIDPSERATRLRQSSPFAGALTQHERQEIYESYATRTYHPSSQ